MERTFVMLKPDAVKRELIGQILTRLENRGLRIKNIKLMQLDEPFLREHYSNIVDKPFFHEVLEEMQSGPVIPLIVEGEYAIKKTKIIVGATQWYDSLPGTIRGDFGISTSENLIHCTDPDDSDPVALAETEIKRFFGDNA